MSLRKSPTLTTAALEANRRNAQKSTGPRTRRGKAQSRMNALRSGWYSPTYRKLCWALADAPPYSIGRTARAILSPEQLANPVFAELVEITLEAEGEVDGRPQVERREREKNFFSWQRSRNVIENKRRASIFPRQNSLSLRGLSDRLLK